MNALFVSRRKKLSRYHISEVNVAKTRLKTSKFVKDSLHIQCILFKNMGDVFAADVMYHCNYLNKYFKSSLWCWFSYGIRSTRWYKDRLEDTFKELTAFMDINKHVYVLSEVRDLMLEKLTDWCFLSCFVLLKPFHKHSLFK